MTTTEFISLTAIFLSFLSTTLVTYFNYKFSIKTKKLDILLANRLTAFKDITNAIFSFKNYCIGRIAYLTASEYSPFYEENCGTLHHRIEIVNSLQANAMFLSSHSRAAVNSLLEQMSGLCNGEAVLISNPDLSLEEEYKLMETLAESTINILYNKLGIDKL